MSIKMDYHGLTSILLDLASNEFRHQSVPDSFLASTSSLMDSFILPSHTRHVPRRGCCSLKGPIRRVATPYAQTGRSKAGSQNKRYSHHCSRKQKPTLLTMSYVRFIASFSTIVTSSSRILLYIVRVLS